MVINKNFGRAISAKKKKKIRRLSKPCGETPTQAWSAPGGVGGCLIEQVELNDYRSYFQMSIA